MDLARSAPPSPPPRWCRSSCPNDANPLGFILGGTVMHLIDIAGAIACHRHTRSLLVTAAVDDLQFLHPIKVGDLIILKARVTCTFTTSLEVQVDVYSEETLTGTRLLTSRAFLTFVAIDARRQARAGAAAARGDRRRAAGLRGSARAARRAAQNRSEGSLDARAEAYEIVLQPAARCARDRCRRGTCSGTGGRRCRRAGSRAARSACSRFSTTTGKFV